MPTSKTSPVVVTTEHRGVFFGQLAASEDRAAKALTLTDAQMCIYWRGGGVTGLAVAGPSATSRVTAAVPRLTLQGVTAVMDCTDEAVKAWQAQPW